MKLLIIVLSRRRMTNHLLYRLNKLVVIKTLLIICRVWPWPEQAKEMWSGLLISIFALNTWLLPYENYNPNGPAWTISTLSFWYWCFPFILPRLQRLTNKELAKSIVKYFWLSVGINYSLVIFLGTFIVGDTVIKIKKI